MAIARKPQRKPEPAPAMGDEAAAAFIAKADRAEPPAAPEEARKAPVMLRFDRDLLRKVDAAAKRRGVSRSSWIQFTLSRALDAGEG